MKRLFAALLSLGLLVGLAPTGSAGPSAGGLSSDNIEYLSSVPFEQSTTTGARVIGKYLYVTSWKSWSIYDISDPENPQMLSVTPFAQDSATNQGDPARFENEDVATNGKILVFSEELPRSMLYVYDVEDKTNPVLLSMTPGFGQHTMSCVLDCKWLYGSDGYIIDLRNPAKPVKEKTGWGEGMPATGGHDVNEVAPGIVLTATDPMMVLDARKDPAHPKLLATAERMNEFIHSVQWPNQTKDKFALSTGETWVPGTDARCKPTSAGLTTWSTTNWKKTHTLTKVDTIRPTNGTVSDGNPPVNAPFGCSSHWFQQHPDFHNGGLVAAGYYNHGTRIYRVDSKGKISEEGWFLPAAGGTSGAYWVTDRIIYAMDYQRGFYILKYTGKF
ncbi:MAG TPA: hypothetical protein VFK89_11395 [Actinomycetota bacterium]|nr:hypothetical protein [Actinomycetota bacterium]